MKPLIISECLKIIFPNDKFESEYDITILDRFRELGIIIQVEHLPNLQILIPNVYLSSYIPKKCGSSYYIVKQKLEIIKKYSGTNKHCMYFGIQLAIYVLINVIDNYAFDNQKTDDFITFANLICDKSNNVDYKFNDIKTKLESTIDYEELFNYLRL